MTGKQVYSRAVSLLGLEVTDVEYYAELAVDCLNQLLADTLWEHNAQRRANGLESIPVSPVIDTLDEELPYAERMVSECFPYGLAALLVAEEDHAEYNRMIEAFEQRLIYHEPVLVTEIRGMDE